MTSPMQGLIGMREGGARWRLRDRNVTGVITVACWLVGLQHAAHATSDRLQGQPGNARPGRETRSAIQRRASRWPLGEPPQVAR